MAKVSPSTGPAPAALKKKMRASDGYGWLWQKLQLQLPKKIDKFLRHRGDGVYARDHAATNRAHKLWGQSYSNTNYTRAEHLVKHAEHMKDYGWRVTMTPEKAQAFIKSAKTANLLSRGLTALGVGGGGFLGFKISVRLAKGKSQELAQTGFKKWAQRIGIALGTAAGAVAGGAATRELALNTIMAMVGRKYLR